ncbi:hypothetical protein Pmar_PMAR013322 [Perkinsus marinus ATCC 50983]|uniref:Uncharacterized protein n=1 Tax=Perkinsus marinus (strain ATCC 50983 / TXsc) TaxID=423536 RepID=C5LVI3_PERM5|nr:hypothetical protein Pmar_PMAR013322 [Perkinsus marinus ATCC 50983]EEQ99270.1 hypothetical protein Pmar_PMAR013322 [Perkinsus marinus ATCC 50983]|eukprot:XP_002766553.1 hypothetical protein Pmar_PMAR013322 [Perkinsus marinus ATCC 50983]
MITNPRRRPFPDLRFFDSGVVGVGMSSLLVPLQGVASECIRNIRSRGDAAARLWVLMSCYMDNEGHFCRELLVCVRDPERDASLLSSVTIFLEANGELQLRPMNIVGSYSKLS